jgi:hypothetical protein
MTILQEDPSGPWGEGRPGVAGMLTLVSEGFARVVRGETGDPVSQFHFQATTHRTMREMLGEFAQMLAPN